MFIAQPCPEGLVRNLCLMVRFPMGIHPIPSMPLEWMTAEGADHSGCDGHVLGTAKTGLHEILLSESPRHDAPISNQSQQVSRE